MLSQVTQMSGAAKRKTPCQDSTSFHLCICVCVAGLVSVAADPHAVESSDTSAPCIQFDATSVDLGMRLENKPASYAFKFQNTGGAPLEVRVDKASCGCLASVVSDSTVPPGGTGTVELKYGADKAHPRHGGQSFSAEVVTNCSDMPKTVLNMAVQLCRVVESSPSVVDFGTIANNSDPISKTVTLYSFESRDRPVVTAVTSKDSMVSAEVVSFQPGHDYSMSDIRVTLDPTKGGKLNSALLVTIRSDAVPELEIPVRAGIEFPNLVQPKSLLFGLVKPGEEVVRFSEFSVGDRGKPASVRCNDSNITCSLEPLSDAVSWRVKAALSNRDSHEQLEKVNSVIEILDESAHKILEIPIIGFRIPNGAPH